LNISYRQNKWILIAVCIWCFPNQAQSKKELFEYHIYDTRHGLPSSIVERVLQTQNGLVWIAHSAGISRFDGYQFENFDIEPDQFENYQIEKDFNGDVWVKSNGQLYLFNEKDFIRVTCPDAIFVSYIYFDEFDVLWVVSKSGVYRLDGKSLAAAKKVQPFLLPLERVIKDTFPVHAVIEGDGNGGIFFSNDTLMYSYSNEAKEKLVGKFSSKIKSLTLLDNGHLLIGTRNGHLFQFQKWDENPAITEYYRNDIALAFTQVLPIDDSTVWLHKEGGLYKFDLNRKKVVGSLSLYRDLDISRTLHVIEDNESGFWFCSTFGLVRAKPGKKSTFETYPQFYGDWSSGLFSLVGDKSGALLLGGNHKTVYSFNKKAVKKLSPFAEKEKGEVNQIFWDQFGYLWIITGWAGIKRWNGATLEDLNYGPLPVVFSLYEDDCGVVWLGTQDGLVRFQNRRSLREVKLEYLKELDNFSHVSVKSFAQDNSGKLWIGTNIGLFYFDKDSHTVVREDSLCQNCHITKLVFDAARNKMWMSTLGDGVISYKVRASGKIAPDAVKSFRKRDGLMTDYFVDMVLDGNSNVWLASFGGISTVRYYNDENNQEKQIVANYPLSKDWIDESFPNIQLYYHPKRKEIFGATLHGLFSFRPDEIRIDRRIPDLEIIGLKVDDADYPLNTDEELRLEPGYYEFQIITNVKNISDKKGIRYQYRLKREGGPAVNTWGAMENPNAAHYSSLGPGEYIFEARAFNSSGLWSDYASLISFTIEKPFFQKAWFRLAVFSGIFGLLCFIILFQRNEWKRVETEKDNVELQLSLIEETQRVQRLRANPHFVSNALSSIQNLIRKGEFERGFNFLNQFYALQRKVLELTGKPLIPLEEEFEFLELYLALENLRFSNQIDYSLEIVERDEEREEVLSTLIPPIILQPIVENAVNHGLLHKTDGSKRLEITASIEDNELICVIEDNGVGREATEKIRKFPSPDHTSQGIEMIKNRLRSIESEIGQRTQFEIQDLHTPQTGTRVKIILPSDLC
jgi:ligand-binding sensor domain-containing protein